MSRSSPANTRSNNFSRTFPGKYVKEEKEEDEEEEETVEEEDEAGPNFRIISI